MNLHSGVVSLLLFAAVLTVPPYGLFGGTLSPAARAGAGTWSKPDARSAGGSAAGGVRNGSAPRDCRGCGTGRR